MRPGVETRCLAAGDLVRRDSETETLRLTETPRLDLRGRMTVRWESVRELPNGLPAVEGVYLGVDPQAEWEIETAADEMRQAA